MPLAVLVLAQALLLFVYFGRERARPESEATFEVEPLKSGPAPALTFDRRDGSRLELRSLRGRPALVHFWATWCAPCARELPALLAAARRAELPLLAVSLDHDFKKVDTFFGGQAPGEVVLGDAAAAKALLGVSTLPDTYLLDAEGRATVRVFGERDWSSRQAGEWLRAAVASRPSPFL